MKKANLNKVGMKYGKLLVIEKLPEKKGSFYLYKCLCDCGNEVVVRSNALNNRGTLSCGCNRSSAVKVGSRYGKLTVKQDLGVTNRKHYYLCVCDCGNKVKIVAGNLTSGNTRSCGDCWFWEHQYPVGTKWKGLTLLELPATEKPHMATFQCDCGNVVKRPFNQVAHSGVATCGQCKNYHKPLVGKYGRLTILKESESRMKDGSRKYLCQCDCGNIIEAARASLVTENTKSCGCLAKDSLRRRGESIRALNNYDLDTKEWGVCFTSDGVEIKFDKEDFELIKKYTWRINSAGYASSTPFGKQVRMHRLIMQPPQGMEVDHINGNRTDNRKCNLRICTHAQNIQNGKRRSHNTSGHVGVYWDKSRSKWMASITENGRTHHLGRYETFEEAVMVRESAENEYFGEYAYKNRPGLDKRVER